MSFDEYIFCTGFIQKTIKVDLDVRLNRDNPWDKQHQKVIEDSRGYHTEAEGERSPSGAGRSHPQTDRSRDPTISLCLTTSVLHHLKDCIYAIYSCRFDPRAQD